MPDDNDSPPPSPTHPRPFPAFPTPFTLSPLISFQPPPAHPGGVDLPERLHQHRQQHQQLQNRLLQIHQWYHQHRQHQRQHQNQLGRPVPFPPPPPPPPPPVPFLTIPAPAPEIGTGQGQFTSVSTTAHSNGRTTVVHQQVSGPGGITTTTSTPAQGTTTIVTRRSTVNTPRRHARASVALPNGTRISSSSNILGQTPADPHGVRGARATLRISRPTGPWRPDPNWEVQDRALMNARRHAMVAAAITRRLPIAPSRPGNLNTDMVASDTVPTTGSLLTILAASLRCCSGYDAVASFAKSNYPMLAQRCNLSPRFLQIGSTSIAAPPLPFTMDTVLHRLVMHHIAQGAVANLRPPNWEGYMQLALELKWVETGMVICGFAGDIPHRIWEQGQDYGGSGEAGKYTEEDVRRKLEGLVWTEVELKYTRD